MSLLLEENAFDPTTHHTTTTTSGLRSTKSSKVSRSQKHRQPNKASNGSQSKQKTTPFEYADFDTKTPQGHYGAGTVTMWNRGGLVVEELRGNEKILFELSGKQLINPLRL